jgi:CRISPR-associated Cas5-like protein
METGLTVDVSFDLAHFKVHTTMKSRASYLMPLPTTILGFFFSILGKSREKYIKERENFKAGAKLINIEGISRENAQLLKLKPNKE